MLWLVSGQGYGAVAPASSLRTPSSQRKASPGTTFLGICAAALVLTVLLGGNARPQPGVAQLAETAHKQMAVAKAAAPVAAAHPVAAAPIKSKAVAPVKGAQKLQDEEAPAEEPAEKPAAEEPAEGGAAEAIDTKDLVPKKVEGGKGKETVKSVEEAFEEKPNGKNSHYVKGYTDKGVHLLIILMLLLGVIVVYYSWKAQEKAQDAGRETLVDTNQVKSKVASMSGRA